MAPKNRGQAPDLIGMARGANFFELVRRIKRLEERGVTTAIRFHSDAGMEFPAADVCSAEQREPHGRVELTISFLNLLGACGVLPENYAEEVLLRTRQGDTAAHDFLDLFVHRLAELLYLAWEENNAAAQFDFGWGRQRLDRHVGAVLGIKEPLAVDPVLLSHAGLLSRQPPSAAAIEGVISSLTNSPVEVVQFDGRWEPLAVAKSWRLGLGDDPNLLGLGTLLGEAVWERNCGILVRIGPVTREAFLDLLPGSPTHGRVKEALQFCLAASFRWRLELVLTRNDFFGMKLADGQDNRLGYSTWLDTRDPPATDPRVPV